MRNFLNSRYHFTLDNCLSLFIARLNIQKNSLTEPKIETEIINLFKTSIFIIWKPGNWLTLRISGLISEWQVETGVNIDFKWVLMLMIDERNHYHYRPIIVPSSTHYWPIIDFQNQFTSFYMMIKSTFIELKQKLHGNLWRSIIAYIKTMLYQKS